MNSSSRRKLLTGYLLVAVAATVLYCLLRHQAWALLSAAPVAGALSWSQVPGMAAFTLLFTLTVFFSAPTNPLFYLAAGYLYGAVAGTAIAVVATTLGSGAAYFFFKSTITSDLPHSLQKMDKGKTFLLLVLLRSSPWFPSPLINVFCGAMRVRLSIFAVSSVVGSLPLISVYTIAAGKLRGPLDASLLRCPEIRIALLILGALSLLGLMKPLRIVAANLRLLCTPLPQRDSA